MNRQLLSASGTTRQAKQRRRQKGFSLLELLVAVTVFALVSAGAYTSLNQLARAQGQIDQRAQALDALQWTVQQLDRDIRQTLADPDNLLDNRQLGLLVLPAARRPDEMSDGPMTVFWSNAGDDGVQRHSNNRRRSQSGLRLAELRYVDRDGSYLPRWTPTPQNPLPQAVEYRLDSEVFGSIRRLVEFPGAR